MTVRTIEISLNNDMGEFLLNEQSLKNYCERIESALKAKYPDAVVSVSPTQDYYRTYIDTDEQGDDEDVRYQLQIITDKLWNEQETWITEEADNA